MQVVLDLSFAPDRDQRRDDTALNAGAYAARATCETRSLQNMIYGERKPGRGAADRTWKKKKKKGSSSREKMKRVLVSSGLVIAACSGCQRT